MLSWASGGVAHELYPRFYLFEHKMLSHSCPRTIGWQMDPINSQEVNLVGGLCSVLVVDHFSGVAVRGIGTMRDTS